MANRTTQFATGIELEREGPDEIVERVRFMDAVQKGLDELERGGNSSRRS